MREAGRYEWWIPKTVGETIVGDLIGWVKDPEGRTYWYIADADTRFRMAGHADLCRRLEMAWIESGSAKVHVRVQYFGKDSEGHGQYKVWFGPEDEVEEDHETA